MARKITCVIFDFDNTLVKSHIDFRGMKISMAQLARQDGLELGVDEDIPLKFTAGSIIDRATEFDQQKQGNLVSRLWALVEDFERKGMEGISIDGEIVPMLKALKKLKIFIALLTNNARNPTVEVLKKFKLMNYFDLIIARENVSKMKPDKAGIELILIKAKTPIEQAIVVGDSWVDGQAANNAKVDFVLFKEDSNDCEKHGIIVWRHIRSMEDLLPLIKGEKEN